MSDSKDTQEPSMEEILSSIRRIIADEEDDGPTPPPGGKPGGGAPGDERWVRLEPVANAVDKAPEDEALDDEAEDVLDLTQRVEEDGEVVDLNARAARAAAEEAPDDDHGRRDDEEVDLAPDEPEFEPEPAPRAAAAPAAAKPVPQQPETQRDRPTVAANPPDHGTLVADAAASAATSAFAKFAQAVTPPEQRVASSEGRTIEEFAEDLLRPMLREWLDENLPAIVERVVEREVNKTARRAELL